MYWIELMAERKIREAQEEGAFEHLPGAGRPLPPDPAARLAPEFRLAYRLLRQTGIAPPWVELDMQVRRGMEELEQRTARLHASLPELAASGRFDAAMAGLAREMLRINLLIDRLNLIAPTAAQQRPRLDVRARMTRLEARLAGADGRTDSPRSWEAELPEPAGRIELRPRIGGRRRARETSP